MARGAGRTFHEARSAAFSAAILLLAAAFSAACGHDEPPPPRVPPLVGTWVLDREATLSAVKDVVEDPEIIATVETMEATLDVRADGTYARQGKSAGDTLEAAGTWKVDGGDVKLTETSEGGKPLEETVVKYAVLEGSRLRFHAEADTLPVVMKKGRPPAAPPR